MLDSHLPDYDFPIEMIDLEAVKEKQDGWKADTYKVPSTMARALVRTDTGAVLGIHGSKYKPINHADAVDKIMEGAVAFASENGLPTPAVDYKMADNGAKLRGELLFKDVVIEPQKDDIIHFRISFFNSYDQSWAFQSIPDGLRLWCLNGCTMPVTTARARFKHTTHVSIDGVAKNMSNGLKAFTSLQGVYQQWAEKGIAYWCVEQFLKKTICKTFQRSQTHNSVNMFRLEELLKQYDRESKTLGHTKWALYNALTYWSTHTDQLQKPEITRKRREEDVAKAIATAEWSEL